MNQVICDAINNRSILKFHYDGQNRVVEPHAHGISTADNEVLRCYQVGGGSNSGEVPGWKMMTVNKISSLIVTENNFTGPRPGYRKGDRGMIRIYCEL